MAGDASADDDGTGCDFSVVFLHEVAGDSLIVRVLPRDAFDTSVYQLRSDAGKTRVAVASVLYHPLCTERIRKVEAACELRPEQQHDQQRPSPPPPQQQQQRAHGEQSLTNRLRQFYERHSRVRLRDVPEIIAQVAGDEVLLNKLLCRKYGVGLALAGDGVAAVVAAPHPPPAHVPGRDGPPRAAAAVAEPPQQQGVDGAGDEQRQGSEERQQNQRRAKKVMIVHYRVLQESYECIERSLAQS